MNYVYMLFFLVSASVRAIQGAEISFFSEKKNEDIVRHIILNYFINTPPFEKYLHLNTEGALFNFLVHSFTKRFYASTPSKYKCICKKWNSIINENRGELLKIGKSIHEKNLLYSPFLIISYARQHHKVYNQDEAKLKNLCLIENPHRGYVKITQKNIENEHEMHFLYGLEVEDKKNCTLRTLLHYVVFPHSKEENERADRQVQIVTYFLTTGVNNASIDDSIKNENGDFTFAGLFKFLENAIENIALHQHTKKTFAPQYAYARSAQENVYKLKQCIANKHKQGSYPRNIHIVQTTAEKEKQYTILVQGTDAVNHGSTITQAAIVWVPLGPVNVLFFHVMMQSLFTKICYHEEDLTVNTYCDGEKINPK